MAISVKFEGINATYHPPKPLIGQSAEPPVHVFKDGQGVMSCWRLTDAELREVAATGVIWLAVRGQEMTPAKVSGHPLVNIGNRPARPIEVGRSKPPLN